MTSCINTVALVSENNLIGNKQQNKHLSKLWLIANILDSIHTSIVYWYRRLVTSNITSTIRITELRCNNVALTNSMCYNRDYIDHGCNRARGPEWHCKSVLSERIMQNHNFDKFESIKSYMGANISINTYLHKKDSYYYPKLEIVIKVITHKALGAVPEGRGRGGCKSSCYSTSI